LKIRKLTSILDTPYSILDTRYSILLFLLIILTFSNCVFAESTNTPKRCKVEYTQLDLITGTETIYKETSQFTNYIDYCKEGLKRLPKKVYKWVDKRTTNIITKINAFKCKVKNFDKYNGMNFKEYWGIYRKCETYIQKLSAYLVDKYPNQIGAEVYKSFEDNR
jgi:hypothetical protein